MRVHQRDGAIGREQQRRQRPPDDLRTAEHDRLGARKIGRTLSRSSIMQPCGVQGTKARSPLHKRPILSGWNPSTSLAGSSAAITARRSMRGAAAAARGCRRPARRVEPGDNRDRIGRASAGRSCSNEAKPGGGAGARLVADIDWLAGSSPTRTAASPGVKPCCSRSAVGRLGDPLAQFRGDRHAVDQPRCHRAEHRPADPHLLRCLFQVGDKVGELRVVLDAGKRHPVARDELARVAQKFGQSCRRPTRCRISSSPANRGNCRRCRPCVRKVRADWGRPPCAAGLERMADLALRLKTACRWRRRPHCRWRVLPQHRQRRRYRLRAVMPSFPRRSRHHAARPGPPASSYGRVPPCATVILDILGEVDRVHPGVTNDRDLSLSRLRRR